MIVSNTISGSLTIFNTGETTATLQHYYSEIYIGKAPPARSTSYIRAAGEVFQSPNLSARMSVEVTFPTGGPKDMEALAEYEAIRRNIEEVKRDVTLPASSPPFKVKENFFLIGWIEYLDEAGQARKAGFCRRYNFHTQRFEIEEDPDYEYEG